MKPIGSEKIQDMDSKLRRILELSGINKNAVNEVASNIGTLSNILHEAVASDGTKYAIVQEEKHVYIKTKSANADDYSYLTGVQNIHEFSYKSYADALKHLNYMFKQINENVGYVTNIDILKKKV